MARHYILSKISFVKCRYHIWVILFGLMTYSLTIMEVEWLERKVQCINNFIPNLSPQTIWSWIQDLYENQSVVCMCQVYYMLCPTYKMNKFLEIKVHLGIWDQMNKAVVSSCKNCGSDRVLIWRKHWIGIISKFTVMSTCMITCHWCILRTAEG